MDDFSTEELIQELHFLAEREDREAAHQTADEILIIAILRAAEGEINTEQAVALVQAYKGAAA